MRLEHDSDGFRLSLGGRMLIRHTRATPFLFVGRGAARMDMHRGNFDIEDRIFERLGLHELEISRHGEGWRIAGRAGCESPVLLALEVTGTADRAELRFLDAAADINRLWLRLVAEPGEHVYGCGEQLSHFDLRGRHFPLWTSEPGVGRDKATEITRLADVDGKAGGDYYTTNYPQPTFLSSRRYFAHLDTSAYADFDFRDADFHELGVWAVPERLELQIASDFPALVTAISDRFGRQPPLPEWILGGAVIGLKDGAESFARLEGLLDAGVRCSALWCEDWAGIRDTSFGSRLFWDWRWNERRYPDLPLRIEALAARGIRFLAYVNPHLCVDGSLFLEAERLGHLARTRQGETYVIDFGEFGCGAVDFTSAAACRWFQERVLRENLIDLGISGWMADFGEYLPIDMCFSNGDDPRLVHNTWPTRWAEVNAAAISAAGRTGDIVFFMRSGYTGVQRFCPLLWAGDQSVDFSRHDGLASVICAALSSGLMGNAYHHSDIGGYTSLFGNVRTPELLQRWAEMAALTPVMRTHEGNRPSQNLQIDQDPAVLAHFARMTRVYDHLTPYLRELIREAARTGLPLQRPLFLHFEADLQTYGIADAYLYGQDLLVAPVHRENAREWSTYLPGPAQWVHAWSGSRYEGGAHVTVAAPLGEPPLFWRVGSPQEPLFRELALVV